MWYTILPSFAITVACCYTIPMYGVSAVGTWYSTGHLYRRNCNNYYLLKMAARDEFLTGNVYINQGLEVVPDLPENDTTTTYEGSKQLSASK
uniref:NADH dehydrogenase [ubiquinone] 1 alpha subcomplex subunit 1 n=1 Tax=Romanomermis culicivorax TaxID=13658 RepID=A0A915I6P6_ROMCU